MQFLLHYKQLLYVLTAFNYLLHRHAWFLLTFRDQDISGKPSLKMLYGKFAAIQLATNAGDAICLLKG